MGFESMEDAERWAENMEFRAKQAKEDALLVKAEPPMGSPANGYRKPLKRLVGQETMTVRQAVARWGDSWRLFIADDHPLKRQYAETVTQDFIEAIDMTHMERGLRRRVEFF